MNKFTLVFFIIFIAGSVSSLAQTRDEKIKSGIRSVMDRQVVAWNAGDVESFMEGYWKSPEMKFVSGDNVARGWQAALDRYKKNYDSSAKMGVLTFSDLEITVLSKKSALVLGNWALEREVDGKKDDPHGKFTLIFRKFKDGWKIIHDHTS